MEHQVETPYLYCFVRKDLPHPTQVVQASHACIDATKAFLDDNLEHPHLVVLGVKDEAALFKSANKLASAGIKFRIFTEPDRDGEATALATEAIFGERRRFFRTYQLLKGAAS